MKAQTTTIYLNAAEAITDAQAQSIERLSQTEIGVGATFVNVYTVDPFIVNLVAVQLSVYGYEVILMEPRQGEAARQSYLKR